jgi:hypothetical protein
LAGTLTASAATNAGGIYISESNDMSIASVSAGSGVVQLTSTGGAIDEFVDDAAAKISTSGALTLTASTSIGATADANEHLDTTATDVTLVFGTDLGLTSSGDLAALSLTGTQSGDTDNTYEVTATNLTFDVTDAGTNYAITDVTDTTGLDFTFQGDESIVVSAISVGAANDVALTSTAGDITDGNAGTLNITAQNLSLTADADGKAIGAAGADALDVTLAGTLTASAATNAGGIYISESNDMSIAVFLLAAVWFN